MCACGDDEKKEHRNTKEGKRFTHKRDLLFIIVCLHFRLRCILSFGVWIKVYALQANLSIGLNITHHTFYTIAYKSAHTHPLSKGQNHLHVFNLTEYICFFHRRQRRRRSLPLLLLLLLLPFRMGLGIFRWGLLLVFMCV